MVNPTRNHTRLVCAAADGKTGSPDRQDLPPEKAERIAKRMARAGLCSRREAEAWIEAGRVRVNGKLLQSAAQTVTDQDRILVDGKPLPAAEQPRVWRYHKPTGVVTTNHDPQGRPTIFDQLPQGLPRVITVGRLDLNSEGLLLLTNDGEIARKLELPSTGWLRKYRARVHGTVNEAKLKKLADGHEVSGIQYGPIHATLERAQTGANAWIEVSLREGKNREVRKVLESIGLTVNRLIRISYGPFLLGNLKEGGVEELAPHVLADQLGIGKKLNREGHAVAKQKPPSRPPKSKAPKSKVHGKPSGKPIRAKGQASDDQSPEAKHQPTNHQGTKRHGDRRSQSWKENQQRGGTKPGKAPGAQKEKAFGKPEGLSGGKLAGKPAGKSFSKSTGKPFGKPTGKPTRKSSGQPAGKPSTRRPSRPGKPRDSR